MIKTFLAAVLVAGCAAFPIEGAERPRARDIGIEPGVMTPGPLNAITDVAGVRVGHRGRTREAFPMTILQRLRQSSGHEEEKMAQEVHDRRIDYIELPTTDLGAAKRFYTSVFGWKTQDWGEDYSSFEDGRLTGGFRKEEVVTSGGPLVVLYAVNLEVVEAAVRANGGTVVKEIFAFPGGRRFHFCDPSGNELAVWSDKE